MPSAKWNWWEHSPASTHPWGHWSWWCTCPGNAKESPSQPSLLLWRGLNCTEGSEKVGKQAYHYTIMQIGCCFSFMWAFCIFKKQEDRAVCEATLQMGNLILNYSHIEKFTWSWEQTEVRFSTGLSLIAAISFSNPDPGIKDRCNVFPRHWAVRTGSMVAGTGAHHKAVNRIPQEELANCARVNCSLEGGVGKNCPSWLDAERWPGCRIPGSHSAAAQMGSGKLPFLPTEIHLGPFTLYAQEATERQVWLKLAC